MGEEAPWEKAQLHTLCISSLWERYKAPCTHAKRDREREGVLSMSGNVLLIKVMSIVTVIKDSIV